MKQYVIDELNIDDFQKIKTYLDENFGESGVSGIYWVPLDKNIYNKKQANHTSCQPYYFAINLKPNQIACELLIRTKNILHCNCISYANIKQRNWIIDMIEFLITNYELRITN